MPSRGLLLNAAAIALVAAFGLSGCGQSGQTSQPPTQVSPVAVAPAGASLPSQDALADVLLDLADTSIPAEQKVGLVQFATPDDQASLANFGEALKASGFAPLTVQATDLVWAGDPGHVMASVTIGAADPAVKTFTYPMEFSPIRDTWQLSRRTADQLLPLIAATRPPG